MWSELGRNWKKTSTRGGVEIHDSWTGETE